MSADDPAGQDGAAGPDDGADPDSTAGQDDGSAAMTAATQQAWRGIAAEDADEITGSLSALLRRRGRRLLARTCCARTAPGAGHPGC